MAIIQNCFLKSLLAAVRFFVHVGDRVPVAIQRAPSYIFCSRFSILQTSGTHVSESVLICLRIIFFLFPQKINLD